MTDNSHRLRFRFSIRTLFVVVTVAALLAWYLRPRGTQIIGDINQGDVEAICKVVSAQVEKGYPILSIELLSPSCVQVNTCDIRGRGTGCKLEKQHDTWRMTLIYHWR